MYLLDYEPRGSNSEGPSEDSSSSHGEFSDTMSIRTEAGNYGQVYGTSAVSAFGGPMSPGHLYRNRTQSTLTVHALPTTEFHGTFGRTANRGRKASRQEPSPLATAAPCLSLHAKMYTAGHTYGIDGLKNLALDKFKIQLTRHW
jgi:hypothetical protein